MCDCLKWSDYNLCLQSSTIPLKYWHIYFDAFGEVGPTQAGRLIWSWSLHKHMLRSHGIWYFKALGTWVKLKLFPTEYLNVYWLCIKETISGPLLSLSKSWWFMDWKLPTGQKFETSVLFLFLWFQTKKNLRFLRSAKISPQTTLQVLRAEAARRSGLSLLSLCVKFSSRLFSL